MDINDKATSNHPWRCLTNIRFSLTTRICAIVEDENVGENALKN